MEEDGCVCMCVPDARGDGSVMIWAVFSRESSGSAIHVDVTTCPGEAVLQTTVYGNDIP